MSIGRQTGVNYPFTQGDFKISLSSTEIIRNSLLGRNLDGSYLNRGNPIPPNGDQEPGSVTYERLNDYSVVDSPLVEDVTNQNGILLKTVQFLSNRFGPESGYGNPLDINVIKLVDAAQIQYVSPNTTQPQGFVSSDYTAIEILNDVQTVNGELVTLNGKILDDSILIKSSIPYLRDNLGYRQSQHLFDVSDDGSSIFNITTQPDGVIEKKGDFISRISGQYVPESSIPGFYFQPVNPPDINGLTNNMILQGTPLNVATQLLNGIYNAITNSNPLPNSPQIKPYPSQTFLDYMGGEQQSQVFEQLNYNVFRPDYTRTLVRSGDIQPPKPNQYLGSITTDPSDIQSPIEATPRNEFGQQIKAIVYGPSEVYKEFDNVEGRALWRFYRIGALGLPTINGGEIEGGFSWAGSASLASPNSSPTFVINRSNNLPLKKGSILAETQSLIDSAPRFGLSRFKHVGNAIDQVSKVFNDGYRTISKGSRVTVSEQILDGVIDAQEFCRAWTKDDPYFRYSNLQKSRGNQWGNPNSVLDSTYNLNITPTKGKSTSLGQNNVRKYMFSIENLAWRGTDKQANLPLSEKGPNGGRIMWFPPYEISVSDTNSATWSDTTFLGRPEPIYTYNYTQRMGSLSFKIIVDHPSILNLVAQSQLKSLTSSQADQLLNSFFSGCRQFDINELAERYSNIPLNELIRLQNGIIEVTNQYVNNPDGTTSEYNSSNISLFDTEGVVNENVVNDNQTQVRSVTPEEFQGIRREKILEILLNEQDYFEYIEENNPFIYQSIKDSIKFFNPSFHSMTPEGLNSRLTFLQQCLRPGETIPTVTEQGTSVIDADNTAFGPPPVCVLRIGDFYHTKVIFDSINFTYDPLVLDMNPEGIGVQPMIVTVQANFKFIGGQGLEGPVSKLQNALSFNYFANTEMYDVRSEVRPKNTPTVSTSETNSNTGNDFFDELSIDNGTETSSVDNGETDSGGDFIEPTEDLA